MSAQKFFPSMMNVESVKRQDFDLRYYRTGDLGSKDLEIEQICREWFGPFIGPDLPTRVEPSCDNVM